MSHREKNTFLCGRDLACRELLGQNAFVARQVAIMFAFVVRAYLLGGLKGELLNATCQVASLVAILVLDVVRRSSLFQLFAHCLCAFFRVM